MKQVVGLILVLLAGCCSLAGAQRFAATVQRYGPEDGLAHREVNAIFQDRRDFIWFGTKLGLSRFDGATFTTYTRETNGLDFDDIHSIAQDADGLLWLMGPTGQSNITLFDPITGVATSFEKRFHRSRPTHFFGVKQSLLSGNDGTIVFVDYQPAKLNIYHPKTGLRTVSLPQYKNLTLKAVTARNTIWVANNHSQLVELTMDGRVLRMYNHPLAVFACLGQSNASTELVYRLTTTNGPLGTIDKLYKLDGVGHRQTLSPALIESAKMQYPLAYAFNQHGLLWNGCQLRDSTGQVLLDITSQLPSGLIEDRSFFWDRTGSMWLGTSFGLFQIRVGRDYFQRLFYEPGEGKKPAARGITAVGKTLYTNLENVGLFSSTLSGESARQLLVGQEVFNSMSGPLGGKLYLAQITTLVAYDYRTTKATMMPTPGPGTMIWSVHPYSTKPHRLLAGGDPGLFLVDPIANRVFPFGSYNQFSELAKAHILHIGADRQGTIWLCATTGLYTVDPKKGVTARYWSGGRGASKLPADSYQHFYQDPQGVFWLATANTGLIRWDRARNSYRQFKRADGLNNDNIYAVYADRRGHLWLSSDNGIMQFDPVRLTTRTYTEQDGITNNEFNRIAHYQDAQGRLYFGGLNGVTTFNPRDFDAEPPLPDLPLRVVSFRQFDTSRNALVDKTNELLETGQITLQPDDRSSILHFALLNYTDARKNTYAYQFNGLNDSWHYQTEPYLRLGNLPYGDYRLLIKGQAADGRMSAAPLSFEVHVLRPFYLRGWFLLLLISLLLGGTWVWGRWRTRKHEQAQVRLQSQIDQATRTIAQQAQDLQQLDEAKSHFFANISHEFRTPLTVILGMADQLQQQVDPQWQQSASLIERNGRSLLRLVNQILDLTKLEAGQMPIKLVRGDLNRFIQYVGESFHSIARTKEIQLIIHVEEDVQEADFNPDKLQDIVVNLLGNALKFTPAGGQVTCEVAIQPRWQSFVPAGYHEVLTPSGHLNDPWIRITVSDTGSGIDPASLTRIFDRFYQARPGVAPPGLAGPHQAEPNAVGSASGGSGIGLSLVRELVSLMQGGLAVRNRPGLSRPGLNPGAEFVVWLPLTRQAPMADDVLPAPIQSATDPVWRNPVWRNPSELGDPVTPDQVESGREEALNHPLLLLVEDNDDVATYIRTCLRDEYQVVRAENGQIGIDQALAITPDLILSDVMMPAKDGFELCDTLKNDERTSHIPIVLLTARAAVDDRMTGLRRGSDAYLVKPFRREELLLVLGNVLQTRRLLQRYYSHRALGNVQPDPVFADGADAREDQFVTKLRSTLELHLANVALDTTMICQLMGMSRNSLYRKMMALTGLSVIPYLRALRLQKAEELLLHSTLSVADIAYAVGFDNPRYFSRVFSEEKGVSPSTYRDKE